MKRGVDIQSAVTHIAALSPQLVCRRHRSHNSDQGISLSHVIQAQPDIHGLRDCVASVRLLPQSTSFDSEVERFRSPLG